MSLLRLLTAGKSLVGLKDGAHRYSVSRRELLPNFPSKKNPFRAATGVAPRPLSDAELTPTPPSEVSSSSCDNDPAAPASASAVDVKPAQLIPRSLPATNSRTEPIRTNPPIGWRAFLPWVRPKIPKPAIPRFEKTMIQCELSLESVKVVRNDLSDSDLEIVPTKPNASAQSEPTRPLTPQSRTNERSWERLTGRFLGAGKT